MLGGFEVGGNPNEMWTLSPDVVAPLQLSNDDTTMYALMTTLTTTANNQTEHVGTF